MWKWTEGMPAWQQIVPPPPPVISRRPAAALGPPGVVRVAPDARRFFVDPYRPWLLYVLSDSHVFRSDTGGLNWVIKCPSKRSLPRAAHFR